MFVNILLNMQFMLDFIYLHMLTLYSTINCILLHQFNVEMVRHPTDLVHFLKKCEISLIDIQIT